MRRIISFIIGLITVVMPFLNIPKADIHPENWTTQYCNVFVHGLFGWGEYHPLNFVMSYWGTFGGDMMRYLQARGIPCRSAAIDQNDSAWDCACELYAEIVGTRTDYGAAHSARCNHPRYGKDYTGCGLVPNISKENKINLFAHSFGGVTILVLEDLLQNGSEEERNAVPKEDLSPLFEGGKGDWIYSMTALCAPLNGTSAYELFDRRSELGYTRFGELNDMMEFLITTESDKKKAPFDNNGYDMHIDNAIALTNSLAVQPDIYYFSLPCSYTQKAENGNWVHKDGIDWCLYYTADIIGQYKCTTAGGYVVDDAWLENDGLVNTISQRAPFNAPQKDFDANDIPSGVWNVYPTFNGDHMSLKGGLFGKFDIRQLYAGMIDTINSLPAKPAAQ